MVCTSFFFVIRLVLEEMEMLSAFTSTLHVPNLSKPEHVLAVLEEHDIFDKKSLQSMAKRMHGHKYELILLNEYFVVFLKSMSSICFFCHLQGIYWHQEAIGFD